MQCLEMNARYTEPGAQVGVRPALKGFSVVGYPVLTWKQDYRKGRTC